MKKIINKKHFNSFVALFVVCLMVIGSISIKGIRANAASTETYSATVKEGSNKTLTITASADKEALEEGVTLKAKKITSTDDQYKDVKEKVEKENKNKKVSFLAYDIGFYKDDQEVEPKGEVKVNLSWTSAIAPTGTTNSDDVSILHLKENNEGKITKVNNITKDDDTKITKQTNKVKSASFTTDSFSVFTITWSKSDTDSTRVGNVKVHYMSETGAELTERPSSTPASELISDTSTSLSDWAKDASDKTRLAGYTYVEAHLEKVSGTKVTDVKVVKNSDNSYSLQYKKDGETTWTTYNDSVSGESENNVDIYLLFTKNPSFTLHYVDEKGNDINDDETETKNAEDLTTAVTVSDWKKDISNYSYKNAHIKSATGSVITSVRAVKDGDSYTLQTKSGDNAWVKASSDDIYLVYEKSSYTAKINVHYMDIGGEPMKDESGKAIVKSIEGADYTSQIDLTDSNASGQSDFVTQFSGYMTFPGNTFNQMSDDQSPSGIFVMGHWPSSALEKINVTRGDVSGHQFRWIQYSDNSLKVRYGNTTVTAEKNSDDAYDIYLMYVPYLTIHYVDSDGNKLYDDFVTSKSIQWGNSVSTNSATLSDYYNNHGTPAHIYSASPTSSDKKEITALSWGHATEGANANNWQTKLTVKDESDTTTVNSLVKDVYMVYEKAKQSSITVHHIDQNGNSIGSDATLDLTAKTYAYSDSSFELTNYAATGAFFGGKDADSGTAFNSVTFAKSGDDWTYQLDSSTAETLDSDKGIWIVYKATDNAVPVVHHIDENGKKIADDTYPYGSSTRVVSTANAYKNTWNGFSRDVSAFKTTISGYSFKAVYIGDYKRNANKYTNDDGSKKGGAIVWDYNTTEKKWHTGYGDTNVSDTAANVSSRVTEVFLDDSSTPSYITDIYTVYTKDPTKLNVHYIYIDSDGNLQKLSKDDSTLSNIGTTAATATGIDPGENGTTTAPLKITEDSKTYEYVGTRLGPAWATSLTKDNLGPNVQSVYLKNDSPVYYTTNNVTLSYLRSGTWSYDSSDGRRFVVTRSGSSGSYNYSLSDSRHGTINLNYKKDNTYTASFHGEEQTTEYTYNPETKLLTVKDWLPNNQTNIYEIYTDSTSNKIWIDDDIKYSGYLKVGISDELSGSGVTDKIYTWYKTVTDSSGNTTTEAVNRKLAGEHYNIEYSPSRRTWLDLEADEGGLNTTTQTAVKYYVTLTYTKNGKTQTIQSEPIDIQYYSDLMNGSFEKPSTLDTSVTKSPLGQYSNATYKAAGGVWQTTGVGVGEDDYSDTTRVGSDIEIVNITDKSSVATSYNFASASAVTTPDGGSQFAELNAEAAGALYQDVVTHPNEQLHYWFSHRARGYYKTTDPEYDTMYVVIMPTKLAMTSGSDGGELKTQSDLVSFIQAHGGYDTSLADSVEEKITYKEDDDGIVVLKVSSSDQAWHNVKMLNNYLAKAGLTRFFFAAGPTAYQVSTDYVRKRGKQMGEIEKSNPTHGNFIDAIGFSQDLPTPEGFNLVVKKTFSGLTEKQIAAMANASTATDVNKASNPFKITITDKYWDKNKSGGAGWTEDTDRLNKALNGAELGYSVSGRDGSYTFTPTATLNGKNLLAGDNTSSVKRNDDGTLTITWTFLNQALADSTDDDVTDRSYYYYVSESEAGVTGYSLDSSVSNTIVHSDSTTASNNYNYRSLEQGDSVTFNMTNTYKDNATSDQPQMIVTKTFSGVTPSTVDAMLGAGYYLTVTNSERKSLKLTGDEAEPIKRVEGETPEDVTVALTKISNDDGSTTLRWIIEGWGAGTYTIKEEGFDATGISSTSNQLSKVTVNGTEISDISNKTTLSKSNITVGGTRATTLEYTSPKTATAASGKSLTTPDPQPADNTNLVIAQYTLNGSKKFIVWTTETLSATTSQAIINKINSSEGLGTDSGATIANTDFHSSANPGTINLTSGSDVLGSMTYNSDSHSLRFSIESGVNNLTWDKYYSAHYNVKDDDNSYSETDIAVKNIYDPLIRLMKVDSSNTSNALSGAGFKLYKYDGNTKKYYPSSETDWTTTADDAKTYTTGNGENSTVLGIIDLPTLEAGTYYLEETKAPDGYNMPTKAVAAFKVTNGIVTMITNTSGLPQAEQSKVNTEATVSWITPYYTIMVTNTAGIVLPWTGGSGTTLFIVIGISLIAIASAILCKRKRYLYKGGDQ